jgi:hypothetical protein
MLYKSKRPWVKRKHKRKKERVKTWRKSFHKKQIPLPLGKEIGSKPKSFKKGRGGEQTGMALQKW